jgi:hypothetical protein
MLYTSKQPPAVVDFCRGFGDCTPAIFSPEAGARPISSHVRRFSRLRVTHFLAGWSGEMHNLYLSRSDQLGVPKWLQIRVGAEKYREFIGDSSMSYIRDFSRKPTRRVAQRLGTLVSFQFVN